MEDSIITSTMPEFKLFCRRLQKAISTLDALIAEHRPTIFQETYLTSEEVRELFGLSLRSLQNYRDNRQIPYTTIGGKFLYPQSKIYKLLEDHYISAER